MKKILKFPLFSYGSAPDGKGQEIITVTMPLGAEILKVCAQFEIPQIWALADTEAPDQDRHFRLFATGQELPENPGTFRGTLLLKGGSLVAHLFEA